MKKVNIAQTIVKEYTEKELVNYIATSLSSLSKVSPATSDDAGYVLGELKIALEDLSSIAKALNEKMNGKTTNIVV